VAEFERVVGAIRRLEAMTETNTEKFEVLQSIPVSRMDIHQAKTEAMKGKTDAKLKEMKARERRKIAHLKTQVACLAS
jgi:DNA-binding FrmR family transcriptional regulator